MNISQQIKNYGPGFTEMWSSVSPGDLTNGENCPRELSRTCSCGKHCSNVDLWHDTDKWIHFDSKYIDSYTLPLCGFVHCNAEHASKLCHSLVWSEQFLNPIRHSDCKKKEDILTRNGNLYAQKLNHTRSAVFRQIKFFSFFKLKDIPSNLFWQHEHTTYYLQKVSIYRC